MPAIDSKNVNWPQDWKDHPDLVMTEEQMAMVNALDLAVPTRVLKDKDWSACERIGDESTTEAEIASHNRIYML